MKTLGTPKLMTAVGAFALLLAISPATVLAQSSENSALSRALSLMQQGQTLEARAQLSDLIFASGLSSAQEAQAAKALTALAKETIFSNKVYEGDPVAFSYTLAPGDTLSGLSRRLGLNVPADMLERINAGNSLVAGQSVKLLRGPFHAQIDKKSFAMYVYLQASDGSRVFVRKAKVALGKNDGTPVGSFRITGKAKHTTWTPPPSMAKKYKNPVKWGQKGYPLGKDGYFMSLRGTDESTRNVKGYGIHGTNAQWSIGKAASHGCIRVGDSDIAQVWMLMSEGASTVRIIP